MKARLLSLLCVAVTCCAGCTTGISTLQTADTLAPNEWHLGASMGYNIPAGTVLRLVGKGYDAADKAASGDTLTDDDLRDFFGAAFAIALNPPFTGEEFVVRHGLVEGVDIGLRYGIESIHLDGKFRLLKAGDWSVSLSVGGAYHFFSGLVFDILDFLDVDDFKRWDVEIPLIAGRRFGEWGFLYFGPKYYLSWWQVDAAFEKTGVVEEESGVLNGIGAFAGFAAGYKHVWALVELAFMYMDGGARVLGANVNLSGLILYPSVGVMVRF